MHLCVWIEPSQVPVMGGEPAENAYSL